MKSTKYIIAELTSFVTNFPKTRVRYEYDSLAKVHVIEVVPNEVYHLDKKYIQWENNLYDQFIIDFPNENICFISDDAIVGIETPSTTLYGLEFTPVSTNKEALEVNYTQITNKDSSSSSSNSHLYQEITSASFFSSTDSLTTLFADNEINSIICSNANYYPLAA